MKPILYRIDVWFCFHLRPAWLRVCWHRLWIREYKFHPSLDFDPGMMQALEYDPKALLRYKIEVEGRRRKAYSMSASTA